MLLLEMPTEEDIRSSFCKSPELQPAGDADKSEKVLLTFTTDFGSGIPELVHGVAASKWVLSLGTSCLVDCDKWHGGDLGEKKGDWFAEKNAEEDDDIFLEVMAVKDPNIELSSRMSMLVVVWFPITEDIESHTCTPFIRNNLWNIMSLSVTTCIPNFQWSNNQYGQKKKESKKWMFYYCYVDGS